MPAPGDQRAVTRRHDRRAAGRATATARCGRSPTSAGTAATSCCPVGRHDEPRRDPVPVPRAGATSSTAALRLAPRFGDARDLRPAARPAWCRLRSDEWGGWVFVNVSGTAAPLLDSLGNLAEFGATYPLGVRSAGRRRRRHRLRARGQLEDRDRELPRVLPLPADPPRARAGSARPTRVTTSTDHRGAWVGGTMELIDDADDDVARRSQSAARCSRACGRRASERRGPLRRRVPQPAASACTPTT